MNLKSLNQPLTLKTLMQLLAIVAAVGLVYYSFKGFNYWLSSGFASPRSVQKSVWKYLRQQSRHSDFTAEYDLRLADKIADLESQSTRLKAQLGKLQTNLTVGTTELRDQQKELKALQNQERDLRNQVRQAERSNTDRSRNLTNQLNAVASARKQVLALQTNLLTATRKSAAHEITLGQLTNQITQLKQQTAIATTNRIEWSTQLSALQKSAKTQSRELQTKDRALQKILANIKSLRARLDKRPNDTNVQARLIASQAEVATFTNEVSELKTTLLANQLQASSIQTNLAELRVEMATLKKDFDVKNKQLYRLQKSSRNLASNLARTASLLNTARSNLTKAQTRAESAQLEFQKASKAFETAKSNWDAKKKAIAEQTAQNTSHQKSLGELKKQQTETQSRWAAIGKDLSEKRRLLSRQPNTYSKEMRKQMALVTAYDPLYRVIGQHLWLAERLLENEDPLQQRYGLGLITEAAQYALKDAADPWLAARICEGFLWPNLELRDADGIAIRNPEDLLNVCSQMFRQAEDTKHIIQNYRLLLEHASNERRADSARYYLAYWLEQQDKFTEAIQLYSAIQSTNLLPRAMQRIEIAQQKRQALN